MCLPALPGEVIVQKRNVYDYGLSEAWLVDRHRIAFWNGVVFLPTGLLAGVVRRKKPSKHLGLILFGVLILAVTVGVFWLGHKVAVDGGRAGGIGAVVMSPILWLVLAGPCAFLFLVFLFRAMLKRKGPVH